MPLLPWGVIEELLKLIRLIIEGVPIEQRRAEAVKWFYLWWPLSKLLVPKEYHAQIESIMKSIKPDDPKPQ